MQESQHFQICGHFIFIRNLHPRACTHVYMCTRVVEEELSISIEPFLVAIDSGVYMSHC